MHGWSLPMDRPDPQGTPRVPDPGRIAGRQISVGQRGDPNNGSPGPGSGAPGPGHTVLSPAAIDIRLARVWLGVNVADGERG